MPTASSSSRTTTAPCGASLSPAPAPPPLLAPSPAATWPTRLPPASAAGQPFTTTPGPDRSAAQRAAHPILGPVEPDQIKLPSGRLDRGHTQVWLAGAHLPSYPRRPHRLMPPMVSPFGCT